MKRMISKRIRLLSIVMSLLMILSVISFPALKAKAAGGTIDDFVERCYTVALERSSDPAGFADWKSQLTNGEAVGAYIAYGFLFSAEYLNKNKSNEDYVTDLYHLFMGREPDTAGFNDWVSQLEAGKSRVDVFAGFANSTEFYNLCDEYGISAGYYVVGYDKEQNNNVNLFVERLYKTCFGRLGDRGGQKNWVEQLLKKQITGSECARRFIQSQEYTNLGLSDEDFVENLYNAIMGRSSDAEGKEYWLDALQMGKTRDEVFAGFSNSTEFSNICDTYKIDKGKYTATNIGELKSTYGDWAVTESPVGFFWGGTWILASKTAAETEKKEALKDLIYYITLDTSETGLQYNWAQGTLNVSDDEDFSDITPANGGSKGTIEIMNQSNEVAKMAYQYVQDHPNFGYKIHCIIITDYVLYDEELTKSLETDQVDLYGVEADVALKYTQGYMSGYAATYESLGINVNKGINDAEIADYTVKIGTRPSDGKVVGLAYQTTGGAFIYRRSIAKDVWGTDDPEFIKQKIGGGTGSWEKYFEAAEQLKAKDYKICSGIGDLWRPFSQCSDDGWVVSGKLKTDLKRESYFDACKKIVENDYSNNTDDWSNEWYLDMMGGEGHEVFGFFGPAWLINYTIIDHCGDKPQGANAVGDTVASAVVMRKSVCKPDILAGQDMFKVYLPANQSVNGSIVSVDDNAISMYFREQAGEYAYGNKDKDTALQDFKDNVKNDMGIEY